MPCKNGVEKNRDNDERGVLVFRCTKKGGLKSVWMKYPPALLLDDLVNKYCRRVFHESLRSDMDILL